MTETLYTKQAYLKEIEATVIHIVENGVILDKTIFYPRGGGQPEDKGLIIAGREYEVTGFERNEEGIIHKVEPGLAVGDIVKLKIDWEYRYQLMRHHTALHILSAVVNRKFENTKVTGGNISFDKARLDFDLSEFKKDMAQGVVDEVNTEIERDHKVSVSFMAREEVEKVPELQRTNIVLPESITTFRIVKIGDIDMQADGGLHVNSTNEIGRVKLVKTDNKGKGRKRVTIAVE